MKNVRYANEVGGILVEQDNGIDLYLDSGELYESLKAQAAPYVPEAKTPEQLAYENNAPILAEIATIEAKMIRSMSELALDPSDTAARTYLEGYKAEIEALRIKLI